MDFTVQSQIRGSKITQLFSKAGLELSFKIAKRTKKKIGKRGRPKRKHSELLSL